ncbi:membrane integrity-associated transporter subunit PqiC [Candidatus Methylospira mobilis]|uniref:Membrane integrity-associated transporter subunit PqiC n=1 Tax=Candidatus Methylospira mobilis TaxID=1808979 RepID=A0A5Q0BP68_9GAMM|nr:PqiC family protein [Candidatus Methylospira mobilis]QFY43536.1 membrane integrity-associated transporter subunit PqiC [Candidatus Methylospira mobilis]
MIRRLQIISAFCFLLLLSGCSSPEPHYYVLADSATAAQRNESAPTDSSVGVGPVEIPEYLDRPQIVTRSGQNELQLAEFDRWAGPLKDNVTQVLAENLRAQLPGNRVAVYPWKRAAGIDYQVTVKILRFDRSVDGDSVLNVHWAILSGDGVKELAAHDAHYTERPAGSGNRDTVAAMNRTLEYFSSDVSHAINMLRKEK